MAKEEGENAELVFIPFPFMGHLPPAVETARKLAGRCPDRISRITILITKFPTPDDKLDSFIQSLTNLPDDDGHISFIPLPEPDNPPDLYSKYFLLQFAEAYKPIVKQTLQRRFGHSPRGKGLAGLVIDPCYAAMVDLAEELSVSSYIFFASGAAFLRMSFHFTSYRVPDIIHDENRSVVALELNLKGFRNPVPATVWTDMFLDKDSGWVEVVLDLGRKIGRSKGTLINTFYELEPDLIRSCTLPLPKPNQYADGDDDLIPRSVYPVGPIVNLNIDSFNDKCEENSIMSWLNSQPSCSVVFLCFGSRGTFNENQVKEIAEGLERSGQRFLWSLRLNPSDSAGSGSGSGRNGGLIFKSPEEYDSFREILPEGFLDRRAGIGRVIGWAPQASVLGHMAVGAFVSHCGWNSVMESVWFGVPLVAWPMYGEQQLNAFALVKEQGIAVEIKMDYKCNDAAANGGVVGAEVIEMAIRKVMEGEEEEGKGLRERTKQMSEMGRKSLEIGGSSYESVGRFVEDVFTNLNS